MALDRSNLILPAGTTLPATTQSDVLPRTPTDARSRWAQATPFQQQRVRQICAFLRAIDDLRGHGTCTSMDQATAWIRARRSDDFPILATGGRNGGTLLNTRNANNWRGQLGVRKGRVNYNNYPVLLTNYKKGNQGRKGANEWWQLFYGIYWTGNEEKFKESYRDTCRQWRGVALPEDGIPAYDHVKYWHARYGDKLTEAFAKKGESWFRNQVCGHIERDWEDVKVGEIWIGDHRKFDFLARGEREDGTPWPMRIWVTLWRDGRSGKVLSYRLYGTWEDEPNAVGIMHTFWDAVQLAGHLPGALYIDNGKDFQKQGFTTPIEINGTPYSICLALGVVVISAIKFNARAKTVERTFLNVSEHCDRKFPSYIGNCPANRREDVWKWAQKNVDRLPTLGQANLLFQDWIHRYEHDTESMSKITGGIPIHQIWDGHVSPREDNIPIEDVRRAMLLPTNETRKVRGGPDGPSIEYATGWYSCEALRNDGSLWGENVHVWLDPLADNAVRNGREVPQHVYLFREDLTPIGALPATIYTTAPAWARTDEEREIVSTKLAEQRSFMRQTRQTFQGITGLPKPLSPGEALAAFATRMGVTPTPPPHDRLIDEEATPSSSPTRRNAKPRASRSAVRKAHAIRHASATEDSNKPETKRPAAPESVRDRIAALRAATL